MFILTKHTKDRMRERGISKEQIKRVFQNPDFIGRNFDNKFVVRRKIDGKSLEVVYVSENDNIIIITCYFL